MEKSEIFNPNTWLDPGLLEGRRLFIISDLHVGDGSARDSFAYYNGENRLNDFLDYFESQPDDPALVILGDLFEFWQCSVGDTIQHNMRLTKRLDRLGAYFIAGNHDDDLLAISQHLKIPLMNRMCTGTIIKRGRKKIALVHGHENDPYNNSRNPSKGRAISIFAGAIEDIVGTPSLDSGNTTLEQSMVKWGDRLITFIFAMVRKKLKGNPPLTSGLTPSQYPKLVKKQVESFAKLRDMGEFTHLVCGHTHFPGQYRDWYNNSGSWHQNKCNFCVVGLKGDIKTYDWDSAAKEATEFKKQLKI